MTIMDKEERFKALCNQPPIELPKIGSKIYVYTSLYIGHGADDFMGGIATVDEITTNKHLPPDHSNYYMVTIKERPDTGYNLRYLLENQKKWKKEYGRKKAHPDPDDSPEFNMWD
jgi:hypothetical protein